MLSASVTLYLRVLEESFTWLGQSPARVLVLIAIAIISVIIVYATSGSEGLRLNVQSLAKMLAAPILVWLVIFAVQLARVPYQAYERQRRAAEESAARVAALDLTIEEMRHSVDMNEPGVHNMMGVIGAFQKYGRAVNPLRPPASPPGILVSAAEDSTRLASEVTSWAVFASGIGNGNLQNLGVRPENLEAESRRGMVPNMLLVHAVTETPEVLTLVDDLGLLLTTRLVFTMPETVGAFPPSVIWLQFGPSVRWRTDETRQRQVRE